MDWVCILGLTATRSSAAFYFVLGFVQTVCVLMQPLALKQCRDWGQGLVHVLVKQSNTIREALLEWLESVFKTLSRYQPYGLNGLYSFIVHTIRSAVFLSVRLSATPLVPSGKRCLKAWCVIIALCTVHYINTTNAFNRHRVLGEGLGRQCVAARRKVRQVFYPKCGHSELLNQFCF